MLVIISDLHLTDGSGGTSISPGALELFAEELRGLAYQASYRGGDRYRPVEQIDLVLLGDVLDPIRSAEWLRQPKLRPWLDPQSAEVAALVTQITQNILRHNETSANVLRQLAHGGLTVPVSDARGRAVTNIPGQPVAIKIHYMVGNHDWFYHLPDPAYHEARRLIVEQLGLSQSSRDPFPHDASENAELLEALRRHRVLARHGDIFDPFNFDGDRCQSSLGDVIVIELLNRFAAQVEQQLGDELPAATVLGLRELDNVRPLVAVPAWLDGLLHRSCPRQETRAAVKRIWDQLADAFLALPVVRERDTWNPLDLVDGLQRVLKFSRCASLEAATRVVEWLQSLAGKDRSSYYRHALSEQDFRNRRAKYIVYGHTHQSEYVPLDASYAEGYVLDQAYFNSGTWRRTLQQTTFAPGEHEFLAQDVMTYLAFYQADERKGRPYETWTGSLGVVAADAPQFRLDLRHAAAPRAPSYHGAARIERASDMTPPLPGARLIPTRRRV